MTVSEGEDEYEEQEELLFLDLKGVVQSEITQEALNNFKLLGIHTPNPILQIGGLIFQGGFEPTVGTAVFFQEQPQSASTLPPLPVFAKRPKKMLQYAYKAHNMIQMKRIFVKPFKENSEAQLLGED
ncbi:general transcription factor 3C polypeptide 6-like [Hyalella azteca]|uniref:General transcription factor 3C polypeptide 6-like n=1 Tax=Hyalella azteca TaxID=294128 RepID=A0A8B7PB21_HYAAZ|nr:general transcription factor 3C polypeptide 6-like [Hyalella azteca]